MKLWSFTAMNILANCFKLWWHYMKTHEAFLGSDALEYGKAEHENFEAAIISETPRNDVENEIVAMANDWMWEYEAVKDKYHGILDLYSPSKNIAIEFKTGSYNPVQLDLYTWLIDGEVYYANKKEFVKHEYNPERLEAFKARANENFKRKTNNITSLCAKCVIANKCPTVEEEIKKGNIDTKLFLAENYKARASLLTKLPLSEGEHETPYHKILIGKQTIYKLQKGIDKEEVKKFLVDMQRLDLLDVKPKNIYQFKPEWVKPIERKTMKVERKEEITWESKEDTLSMKSY